MASCKLRQYFQASPILVMMDQPIRKSMNKPKAVGRMVQWAIELSQFDIEYHFIAKFTLPDEENLSPEAERWTIQTDGSSA